jgi:copper chaperone NosL
MRPQTRVMLMIAALLMALAYVAPLWQISLEAPQYPEGLGMSIWIDTITGQQPNDLNSINNLNHYIGMKAIVPDAIPELRAMPLIVGALLAFGLLAAAIGRRSLLYVWTISFVLAAAAGLVDFWQWGYDYGHNLDPTAAIKVPGLSYQPPLIGSKQLLNFTAHSWPGLGGVAIAAALLIGVALCLIELRRQGLSARQLRRTQSSCAVVSSF